MSSEGFSEDTESDEDVGEVISGDETRRLYQELESISIPDDVVGFGGGDDFDLEFSRNDVREERSDILSVCQEESVESKGEMTEDEKWRYVHSQNHLARVLFGAIKSFKGPSSLIVAGVDIGFLEECIAFDNGYRHRMPRPGDKIWEMPEYGFHGVPVIYFEFGLRLPMHPFLLCLYNAIGCGFGQLSPNAIVQVGGVIARCAEMGISPSLELLFSIYGAKYYKGQVYLDKRRGGVAVVKTPSSNHSWHPKFTFLEGWDLSLIGSWRHVDAARLKSLTDLPKLSYAEVQSFCGLEPSFHYSQFKDIGFLESHNLAGETLKEIVRTGNMISERTFALLAKRGAEVAASTRQGAVVALNASKSGRGEDGSSSVVRGGISKGPEKGTPLEDELTKDRRRHRSKEDGHHSKRYRTDAPKNLTHDEVTLPDSKSGDEVRMKVPVSVSDGVLVRVDGSESWIVGKTHPLHALDIFGLPQDDAEYAEMSQDEAELRSLQRFGQFASDFYRVVKRSRGAVGPDGRERMAREIADLKKQIAAAEVNVKEDVAREKTFVDKLEMKEKTWKETNEASEKKITEMGLAVEKLRTENSEMKKEMEGNALELARLQQKNVEDTDSISRLQLSLVQSEQEAARNVEAGYKLCLGQLEKAGLDCAGHEFEAYLAGLAVVPRI